MNGPQFTNQALNIPFGEWKRRGSPGSREGTRALRTLFTRGAIPFLPGIAQGKELKVRRRRGLRPRKRNTHFFQVTKTHQRMRRRVGPVRKDKTKLCRVSHNRPIIKLSGGCQGHRKKKRKKIHGGELPFYWESLSIQKSASSLWWPRSGCKREGKGKVLPLLG